MRRLSILPALLLAACGSGDAGRGTAGDWRQHGRDSQETRFSPLADINRDTVSRLKLAWSHDLDTDRGQESTPLVVDGVMYVTTAWSKVLALDAATGKELWSHDPQVPGKYGARSCCDVVNRGAAYDNGKIYSATLDGRLIALDAKSGKLLWSTVTVDQTKAYTITGAPRVARGKVFIGNGGAEFGVRGYVSAYDAETGKLVWRFYTVPGKPGAPDGAASDAVIEKLARPTWSGDAYWRAGGGGTVWDSIVYDSELNRLYIGVGNGSPWNRRFRSEDKGDNLFLSSIVALDPDTGKYLWHYQETPGETWDFTATQQMTLTDLEIGGRNRKVILHAPKNGFFYVVDRTNGALISAEKFVPLNWADRVDPVSGRPVENPAARFRDEPFLATVGGAGAHNWHPMAFSPKTGLVYIPAQQIPYFYKSADSFKFEEGRLNLGLASGDYKPPTSKKDIAAFMNMMRGELVAWDPVKQRAAWRVPHKRAWNGGILATDGGLVFQGLADGSFQAFDAVNGKTLWQFDAQVPLLPGPISYRVDGRQYIVIIAGNGGALPLSFPEFDGPRPRIAGRVLAFTLDGKAKLPPVTATIPPLKTLPLVWSRKRIAEGRALFTTTCGACHGMGAMSAGVVPDLRRSNALGDANLWNKIVIEGALTESGMIGFGGRITPNQAQTIRAYVACRASPNPGGCDF